MRRAIVILFAFMHLSAMAQPTKWDSKKFFTIMSYNVENLFDTIDTQGKNDKEFTPQGKKKWNTKRYYEKLKHLSMVIDSVIPKGEPDIVALTEVENKAVMLDLASQEAIKNVGYKCILEEGPDPRGIDCGLMYNPNTFNYISHKAIQVLLKPSNRRTRDILYVKGLSGKDTLHVFVNHWPSRVGGAEETANKRAQCASLLKHIVDSIQQIVPNSNIIIVGDMNDEPENESIYEILSAKETTQYSQLYNLCYAPKKLGKGTYFYNGEYSMLDNIIVNRKLITSKKGFRLYNNEVYIYSPKFIQYTDKKGNVMPSRSYSGNYYTGGFSDHYPVFIIFHKK